MGDIFVDIFNINLKMKIIISSIVGLIITAIIFAQTITRENRAIADTIEYITSETIGGKLDFTAILKEPGFLPIDHKGVRLIEMTIMFFCGGKQSATWDLSRVRRL